MKVPYHQIKDKRYLLQLNASTQTNIHTEEKILPVRTKQTILEIKKYGFAWRSKFIYEVPLNYLFWTVSVIFWIYLRMRGILDHSEENLCEVIASKLTE